MGEWPLLLDMLCGGLVLDQTSVTPEDQDALASFLRYVGEKNPDMKWSSSPDTTLAALNVIDHLPDDPREVDVLGV